MQIFSVTRESAVYSRQKLGTVPADVYARDKPFVPSSIDPPHDLEKGREVYGDVPERDASGGLVVTQEQVELQGEPYNPVKRAAGSALLGGVAAGLVAGLRYGPALALPLAVAGAAVSGGIGYVTAQGDALSVETVQQPVFEPVFQGFTHHTLDGAFVPNKPVHWWNDGSGTLHYYMEKIEQREVGRISVPELRHSAQPPLVSAGLSIAAGVAIGLMV